MVTIGDCCETKHDQADSLLCGVFGSILL